jgi:hypothetical protein
MSLPNDLTLKLLRDHYPVVLSLRDYLTQISEPNPGLEQPDDLERYLSLVKTSYVTLTEPFDASTLKKFQTGDVMSEMYEVGRIWPLSRVYGTSTETVMAYRSLTESK